MARRLGVVRGDLKRFRWANEGCCLLRSSDIVVVGGFSGPVIKSVEPAGLYEPDTWPVWFDFLGNFTYCPL